MNSAPEKPPSRLWHTELCDLLHWYEGNLCAPQLIDPRGCRVVFSLERFPHLIKLLRKDSSKEVLEPQKQASAIRDGSKRNCDFGGYNTDRAQTLAWIPPIILRPSMIVEVVERTIWEKPGDTLYLKQFDKPGYRYKVLVCRTVGEKRLAPVTCHPKENARLSKAYRITWQP